MMITINLLPEENRKRERTPIVVFLPVVLGLIAVLSAASFTAYFHFVRLSGAEGQKRAMQADLDQKTSNLKYETALLAEEGEYKSRAQTISDMAASRILVTKTLDDLWGTVASGDSNGDYLVWLSEIKSTPPKSSAGQKSAGPRLGGEIAMKGYTLADHDPLLDFNRFHAAVKASQLMKQSTEISNPDGKVTAFNDDRTPRKGWTVDLTLTLLHPTELLKAAAKTPGQVAEKPGQKAKK